MAEPRENIEKIEEPQDKYTNAIGELGKWQLFLFVITMIPIKVSLPNVHFGIVFLAPKISYRCLERVNATEDLVNMTCYSDCKKYEYFSEIEGNIISQWDLICDRAWIADFVQMVCMFGILVGSVVFGVLGDKYGRKTTLILAAILETCTNFLMPFCPQLWLFIVVRFFIGAASGGTNMMAFVLLTEVFGQRKRNLLGYIFMLPLTLGHLLVSVLAYYYRNWKVFSVASALPTLTYLTYFFCIPESPKWLISVGRLEEACTVMTSAAKWNQLPTDNMMAIVENIDRELNCTGKSQRKATLKDLFLLPSLRTKNLCSCLVWFATGITLYGSMQFFGQTSSNVFVMFTVIGIVQVPGILAGGYISNTYGRRVAVIALFVISGVGNGILAMSDKWYYLKLIAGTISISSECAIVCLIQVFTTELFPTVARSMGMGASCTVIRLGSMLAPFIGGLHKQEEGWIPVIVFTTVPIVGVIACFCLPETLGKKLEDHVK